MARHLGIVFVPVLPYQDARTRQSASTRLDIATLRVGRVFPRGWFMPLRIVGCQMLKDPVVSRVDRDFERKHALA